MKHNVTALDIRDIDHAADILHSSALEIRAIYYNARQGGWCNDKKKNQYNDFMITLLRLRGIVDGSPFNATPPTKDAVPIKGDA